MDFHNRLNQLSSYKSKKRLNAHANYKDASIILKPSSFSLVLASSKKHLSYFKQTRTINLFHN